MIRNKFIGIFQFSVLLVNTVRLSYVPNYLDTEFIFYTLLLSALSFLSFFLIYDRVPNLRGQFFKISIVFLVGFYIVHFQMYYDLLLGNYRYFSDDYLIDPHIVPKAMIVACDALNVFILGYLVNLKNQIRVFKSRSARFNSSKIIKYRTVIVLIYTSFAIFVGFSNAQYFSGQYGAVALGIVATYAQTFLLYAINAYIIIVSYNIKVRGDKISFRKYVAEFKPLVLLLVTLYLLLVMISGDRGPIIEVMVLFVSGFIFSQNFRLKLGLFLLFLFIASLSIATLGIVRQFNSSGSFLGRVKLADSYGNKFAAQNSVSPTTFELSTSVRTLNAAVDYVEHSSPKYGLFQLFQIFAVVPGLGSLVKSVTGLATYQVESADFITRYILGAFPSHGLGTSCVADIYLDFSIYGVIVMFFLFGIFVRYIESGSFMERAPALFLWVVAFVFMSKAIYIGRSSILILFRNCVFIYFIIKLSNNGFGKETREIK